jgi:hypothetical protein
MISYRSNPASTTVEGIQSMAKRATKKKTATKKKAKKTEVAKVDNRSPISKEFDCRAGSKKEKVIEALKAAGIGKFAPRKDLIKAAYGNQSDENAGKLAMVLKGVAADAKSLKLGYVLEKKKDAETKELSFGLHTK